MAFAEERSLDFVVRPRVRGVVPVEASAAFRGPHEQGHEDAAIHGAGLVPDLALGGVGEDPCRRLAQEVAHGVLDVDAREEPLGARLDEAAHEGAVLVERRPAV